MENARKTVAGLIIISWAANFLAAILGLLGVVNFFSKIIFLVSLISLIVMVAGIAIVNQVSK